MCGVFDGMECVCVERDQNPVLSVSLLPFEV